MKNKSSQRNQSSKVTDAFNNEAEKTSTVVANKKHHKKPKKQYL